MGALVGTEPVPESWSYDSGVKDYGVYVETGSKPGATTRWWLGSGAISSTTDGEINRDWIYVSARVTIGGLHVFAQQAVDVNRGWREDAEGSTFTSSGTFAAVRWQATPSWSFDAGIDNRRNVRIYRDRVTPATEFDDTYRQGYRAGVQWLGQGHWLVGVDGRTNRGGDAGSSDAWTLRLGALDLASAGLDARLRATTYTGPLVDGTVLDASVSARAGESVRLDVHGGTRSDEDNYGFDESRTISWYGLGIEILPGRHVWITATYDRTTGGDEDNDQAYVTSSWRW